MILILIPSNVFTIIYLTGSEECRLTEHTAYGKIYFMVFCKAQYLDPRLTIYAYVVYIIF